MAKKSWYLGRIKGTNEDVYLYDFSWNCDWYWGGGYIGNRNFHSHFDSCFLDTPDIRGHCLGAFYTPWATIPEYHKSSAVILRNGCAVWEPLSTFLDYPQYDEKEWWRIKDLFKQFYSLRDAAETFRHGGHCTSAGRTKEEINLQMAEAINSHIENVIIPLIRKAMNKEE